jgi:hypothetical protein
MSQNVNHAAKRSAPVDPNFDFVFARGNTSFGANEQYRFHQSLH